MDRLVLPARSRRRSLARRSPLTDLGYRCLPVLLTLLSVAPAHAYTWPFARYTETEGAPTSAVMGLAQTPDGCLWFASRIGMVRYDGSTWEVHDATSGLPVAWQSDVTVDHNGDLWALSQTAPVRVCRLVDGRWQMLPYWSGVGAGVETVELVAGREADGGVALAAFVERSRLAVWSRERWREIVLPPEAGVMHSVAWQGPDLLVATAHGLYRQVAPGRADATPPTRVAGLPGGPVYAAMVHPATGALFVAGEGWFGELTPDGLVPQEGAERLRVVDPADGVEAAIDYLGGLYLGSSRSLVYLHPLLGVETLTSEQGLVSTGLTDILVDREGSVWISNLRGVNKLASRRLRSYTAADGLLGDEVSAILQRRDGTMVLGHAGGLTVMNGGTPHAVPLIAPGKDWSRAMDLYEDATGFLWAAMDRSGLARLDARGRVRWYGPADGLVGAVFTAVHAADGHLWVGTANGVFRQSGERFEQVDVRVDAQTKIGSIRRLHRALDGAILAASGRHGVVRVAPEGTTNWPGDEASGRAGVYAVYEPRPDDFWIGTGGGLCRLRDGKLQPTAAPEPVIDEPVYAITPDRQGQIWFGTAAGVLVWDGASLRRYGVADGLCGAETNRDALVCDEEGRLWIGTDRGLSIYDARLASNPNVKLPLTITGFEVDGQRQPSGVELRLPANPHEVVVRFSAPSFGDEARLGFSTYLEGVDAHWSEPRPNPTRSMRFAHLPPGRFRFQVRAIDVDGRASDVASSAAIVVAAPLRQRPWFIALEIVVLAGVVWLIGSLVQGRRYARRLTAEVAARTEELARSEASVRSESRRLAAVLASISDGVITVDAGRTVTLANPAASELLGRPGTSLVGQQADDLLPGLIGAADDALFAAHGETAREAGARALFEFRPPALDGGTIVLECAVARLATGGPGAGLVLAFRDLTERRRGEQAAIRTQKLESLGVLAGGIAHDFNNLLTVIMGNASLLTATCPLDQSRPLDQIAAAAVRAQRLTAQLLTFARGGSPQKRLTDLGPLLREASSLAVAGTSVSLVEDIADDLWDAEVDPGQMEQVISNLLINARQAMVDGGRIWLSARNLPDVADNLAGRQVEVRVRDEGCGIAPADLERIFEPYFTTKETGTGLGLAITHSIIARHGGSLQVTSDLGRGAEFTLRLPASGRRAAAATAAVASVGGAGGRILVLDDEEPVRDLLSRLLARLGHEAVATADGESALALWQSAKATGRPFTAAIMDLTIPGGLGGRETMVRLRALDPDARAIVTSGYSQDPVLADYRRHGFAAKLPKPFAGDDVARALHTALA